MHWIDPLQMALLAVLPISFAATTGGLGWLAWTMWRDAGPGLGRGLRGMYAWMTAMSAVLTVVLGTLAWRALDNQLALGWLLALVAMNATASMSAYWGWRVRNAYLGLARQIEAQTATGLQQDATELRQDATEIRQDRREAEWKSQ